MMREYDMKQGSPEWLSIRAGKVTGSMFKVALGKGKTRDDYLHRLAKEAVTGVLEPTYSNTAMEFGTQAEPFAREAYMAKTGNIVREVGFIEVSDRIGVSPDGLVGGDGGVEIKCPKPETHLKYLKSQKLPSQYRAQVQGTMGYTGRSWWDFVSYDPTNKDEPLFILRCPFDASYFADLRDKVSKFVVELEGLIAKPATIKAPNWEKINLGKCRHGILCAILQGGASALDLVENAPYLAKINDLAHFSMTGELPSEKNN
jgi:putative phage-type endonuclease